MRKRKRTNRVPGQRKRRIALCDEYAVQLRGSMNTTQAASQTTWATLRRGLNRIMSGQCPRTGDPLPVGEDGAEYLA